MKLLEHLQIAYSGEDNNIKTSCIHCGASALSIDSEAPHQYQCWKCKQSGNAFTFIRKWYEKLPKLVPEQAKKLCAMKKGIKLLTLRDSGIKFHKGCYWIPVYNQKNHLIAVHKYVPEINVVYNSPKPTALTVLGLEKMTSSDTVWIAEGHWDYYTIQPLMVGTGIDLLGTCGSFFNSAFLQVLKDKHIVMLYDNDVAGSDGVDYVARNIKSNSVQHLSLSFLDWSKITLPKSELTLGFDVRDLYNEFNTQQGLK